MTNATTHIAGVLRAATVALLLPALASAAEPGSAEAAGQPGTDESGAMDASPADEPRERATADTAPPQGEISDDSMANAVERELHSAQGLDGENISVTVEDGTLVLTGEVANMLAHDRALRIARSVKGVEALEDELAIRPSDRSDTEIETDVTTALALDPATESWDVDTDVQNGEITLTGTVESFAEKALAEKIVKSVRGVRAIDNAIDIDYQLIRTDSQIAHDVTELLKWNTTVDSASIDVGVQDGVVSLAGTVDSLYEKYQAAHLSWVAGVNDVDLSGLEVQWSADEPQDTAEAAELSGASISAAVRMAMAADPRVQAFEPEVEVENRVVTLSGTVDNLKAKRAAAQAARDTLGVADVRNQLTVEPEPVVADDKLEQQVQEALLRDPYVSGFAVEVTAVDGEIYLYGDVDSYFERLEAGDAAARIAGVTDVHNELDVSYEIPVVYTFYDWDPILYDYGFDYQYEVAKPDEDIRDSIATELAWSPFVDAGDIEIEVSSGVATLTGTVDDRHARRAATENALEGGAYKVLNQLEVGDDPAT